MRALPHPERSLRRRPPQHLRTARDRFYIAILETGSGSDDDLLATLHTLLPADSRWQHRHGSPGHGRDHVLPALVPPHATLPVIGGRLELGTWQSVCLVDTNIDNSDRQVRLSFLGQ